MRPTAIIYGSSLGNTRYVAEKLQLLLPGANLFPAEEVTIKTLSAYPNLILGASTWGVGLLQDEFENFVSVLLQSPLEGKTIALFGLGDQHNYPDTFCDGIGKLHDLLNNQNVNFIGAWPADEYDFSSSRAWKGDYLVGLALDEDNEPDLTDYRLKKWVELIEPLL